MLVRYMPEIPEKCFLKKSHPTDSGFDIFSNEDIEIPPKSVMVVSTGVFVTPPENFEVQVRSRSGNAARGLLVANSPGTVDATYTGECKVILFNTLSVPFRIKKHESKVAQLVLCPVFTCELQETVVSGEEEAVLAGVEHLIERGVKTSRGNAGFGSTGG